MLRLAMTWFQCDLYAVENLLLILTWCFLAFKILSAVCNKVRVPGPLSKGVLLEHVYFVAVTEVSVKSARREIDTDCKAVHHLARYHPLTNTWSMTQGTVADMFFVCQDTYYGVGQASKAYQVYIDYTPLTRRLRNACVTVKSLTGLSDTGMNARSVTVSITTIDPVRVCVYKDVLLVFYPVYAYVHLNFYAWRCNAFDLSTGQALTQGVYANLHNITGAICELDLGSIAVGVDGIYIQVDMRTLHYNGVWTHLHDHPDLYPDERDVVMPRRNHVVIGKLRISSQMTPVFTWQDLDDELIVGQNPLDGPDLTTSNMTETFWERANNLIVLDSHFILPGLPGHDNGYLVLMQPHRVVKLPSHIYPTSNGTARYQITTAIVV
jgi:hypothetical protein